MNGISVIDHLKIDYMSNLYAWMMTFVSYCFLTHIHGEHAAPATRWVERETHEPSWVPLADCRGLTSNWRIWTLKSALSRWEATIMHVHIRATMKQISVVSKPHIQVENSCIFLSKLTIWPQSAKKNCKCALYIINLN